MTGYSLVMFQADGTVRRQPVVAWLTLSDGTIAGLVDLSHGLRVGGVYSARLKAYPIEVSWDWKMLGDPEFDSVWGFLADNLPLPSSSRVLEVRYQRDEATKAKAS